MLNLILPALAFIAIGDAAVMIVRGLLHFGEPWGHMEVWWVLTNASLDACFVALMFPIVWIISVKKRYQTPLTALLVIAVVLAKSNTALFVLGITAFSVLPKKIFLLAPLSYFAMGSKFAQDMGRFHNWKTMMAFWYENINLWLGAGPGTYWVYSQAVQAHKVGDAVFAWMHNDFLQVLFEQGIIGLSCVLFLYLSMIWKAFNRPVLLSMVVGFGVIAFTLYPLHLFMFQILGTALIFLCFQKNKLTKGTI